jgi:hypothetical protein
LLCCMILAYQPGPLIVAMTHDSKKELQQNHFLLSCINKFGKVSTTSSSL